MIPGQSGHAKLKFTIKRCKAALHLVLGCPALVHSCNWWKSAGAHIRLRCQGFVNKFYVYVYSDTFPPVERCKDALHRCKAALYRVEQWKDALHRHKAALLWV